MYSFACKYADIDCDWVGKADTKEELLKIEGKHLKHFHNIDLSMFSKDRIDAVEAYMKED